MLIYSELKNKPREFLAATGLKLDEFEQLLLAFQTAYEKKSPPHLTQEGKTRQRQIGGGATGTLPKSEDKLFFILVYQKTNPLQTMHGLQCGLSQPQANDWMHRLLPVLQQALRDLGEAPERDARRVATSDLARAGGPDLTIDGSARRRQRPQDNAKQKEHYSGKKHTTTKTSSSSKKTRRRSWIGVPPWRAKPTIRRPRMTRRSRIQTTPRSTKTRAFRVMSRQAPRPGNPKKAQRQRVERQ